MIPDLPDALIAILMEALLVFLFIGLAFGAGVVRSRLPDKLKTITTTLGACTLIIWFWLFEDGLIYWKIIITVVALSSLFKLFKTTRNKTQIN